jgi:hypothetical protein
MKKKEIFLMRLAGLDSLKLSEPNEITIVVKARGRGWKNFKFI